ncbi:MAG: DMT family transporter [Thermoplasmata archaeon]
MSNIKLSSRASETVLFLLMASFWALNFPLVKIALLYEPPLFLLLMRICLGFATSFLLFRYVKVPKGLKTNLLIFIVGVFNLVLLMGLWFIGEETETSSISAILIYTYPLFNILFAYLFLKEKLSILSISGTIIGFAGIILIFSNGILIAHVAGILILLVAAISWASGTVIYKKFLSGSVDSATVNSLQFLYAIPVILIWALLTEKLNLSGISLSFIVIILYMGILGTGLAYYIYFYLYKKYMVSSISSYFFIVPALSIVFAFVILGEIESYLTYIGFLLVAIGIYLSSKNTKNKNDN